MVKVHTQGGQCLLSKSPKFSVIQILYGLLIQFYSILMCFFLYIGKVFIEWDACFTVKSAYNSLLVLRKRGRHLQVLLLRQCHQFLTGGCMVSYDLLRKISHLLHR